jgi:hypothetical protein
MLLIEYILYSMPHRGLFGRGFRASHSGEARVDEAVDYGLRLVYWGSSLPHMPVKDGILSKMERNNQLPNAYLNDVPVPTLPEQFAISPSVSTRSCATIEHHDTGY